MSQSTLDDDLFSEAASEMRADVESSLDLARAELPAADDIWEIDADNTLGMLNSLRSALDTGDAAEHLRDAKKWYTMGEKADAFEDGEELAAEIESVEDTLDSLAQAETTTADLTSAIPELKNVLEEAADVVEDAEEADTDEADAETAGA